jgi:hypothetical protein
MLAFGGACCMPSRRPLLLLLLLSLLTASLYVPAAAAAAAAAAATVESTSASGEGVATRTGAGSQQGSAQPTPRNNGAAGAAAGATGSASSGDAGAQQAAGAGAQPSCSSRVEQLLYSEFDCNGVTRKAAQALLYRRHIRDIKTRCAADGVQGLTPRKRIQLLARPHAAAAAIRHVASPRLAGSWPCRFNADFDQLVKRKAGDADKLSDLNTRIDEIQKELAKMGALVSAAAGPTGPAGVLLRPCAHAPWQRHTSLWPCSIADEY